MTDNDDWAAALAGPPKKPMKRRTKILLWVFAAFVAWFTLSNASFLAPDPVGKPRLIAHRGVYHLYDKRAATGRDTCTAAFAYPPEHEIFENTPGSMRWAVGLGANMVEVDVAPTKDGRMVLFHDWTVDCRTNGKGETRDLTLAQLKALDIGYGYTADGGKSFPLRGKGVGQIPTVEEGLDALPIHPILFNFKSKDAAEADQLFAILKASGRDSAKLGDAFYGAAGPVKRMRELLPTNWSFDDQGRSDPLHQGLCRVGLDRHRPRKLPRRRARHPDQLSMGLLGLARPADPAHGQRRRTHHPVRPL
jgi:glycerophosphoryl diester phosphodiesterase